MKWLQKRHAMIDLETCDILPTSAIMSIGAVAFSLDGAAMMDKFYINVDPRDCKKYGCTVSKDTMDFWSKQSKEVIAALQNPKPVPLELALQTLFAWYKASGAKHVWGHGADFDLSIIKHAAGKVGIELPWSYGETMCLRTACTMIDKKVVRGDNVHNALTDALDQANFLITNFGNDDIPY